MAPGRGVTVALDGFGAEQGFDVLAEGARLRRRRRDRRPRLRPASAALGLDGVDGIEVVPTTEWIGNEEDPVPAVRAQAGGLGRARRRATSPRAAPTRWSATARPGRRWPPRPSACGACKGVQRPALAVQLPVPGKPVLFLDVGANVEVRAQHLVQFAFLGAAFSAAVLERRRTRRVGLLTVGEEAGKGREEVVEAHRAARRGAAGSSSPATSRAATCRPPTADVVVTDGFTGNVALKLMEGTARTVTGAIRDAARSNPVSPRSAAC